MIERNRVIQMLRDGNCNELVGNKLVSEIAANMLECSVTLKEQAARDAYLSQDINTAVAFAQFTHYGEEWAVTVMPRPDTGRWYRIMVPVPVTEVAQWIGLEEVQAITEERCQSD
jgi:hypothetical protein